MLRRPVLAVVGLSMSTVAFTAEVDVAELTSSAFVSGRRARSPRVPAAGAAPAARLVWTRPVGRGHRRRGAGAAGGGAPAAGDGCPGDLAAG